MYYFIDIQFLIPQLTNFCVNMHAKGLSHHVTKVVSV